MLRASCPCVRQRGRRRYALLGHDCPSHAAWHGQSCPCHRRRGRRRYGSIRLLRTSRRRGRRRYAERVRGVGILLASRVA
ncbi:MAG: hypothetical protein NZ874_10135 [Fimbriimonadales bacterium]|nr:hypothetical protein [Fimbriimonadales bacterium]